MKKLSVVASVTFFLSFLALFFYFYKNSRKFRKSIVSALLAALVLFSWPLESSAKDADAFTPQEQSRPYKRPYKLSGFFNSRSNNNGSGPGKPNNDGSGPEKPNNDGSIPKYPRLESVEATEERLARINEHLRRMKKISNPDTESEEDQCRIDQQIQFEGVKNQNSGLTKARNNLIRVKDDKLTSEGDLVNPSKLTSKAQSVINKTKDRRSGPLLKSRYEDRNRKFLPAYSIQQVENKNKHTLEALQKLGKNITKYNELPQNKQLEIDLDIVEGLLAHPDTELHMNAMGQGREPIAMILNRGLGNYSLKNHIGTFERRPEIFEYNSYIANYVATDAQIKKFDLSNSTSIKYEDLVGNSYTNIGPIFGKSVVTDNSVPTTSPTVNNVDSEL